MFSDTKQFEIAKGEPVLDWTGERYVPGVTGEVELEHLHRYLLASLAATGKDVLDVASGEGYGADLLALTARSVVGVEIDPKVVRHAEERYPRSNLRFLLGACQSLPIASSSVDLVVSFETLEHIAEQEIFLREVKRVLRPGGALLISTPDTEVYNQGLREPNPHHVKELTRQGFVDLLSAVFRHVTIYDQGIPPASLILPGTVGHRAGSAATMAFWRKKDGRISSHRGLPAGMYMIAVAGDDAIPDLGASGFEGDFPPNYISALLGGLDERDGTIKALHAANAVQGGEVSALRGRLVMREAAAAREAEQFNERLAEAKDLAQGHARMAADLRRQLDEVRERLTAAEDDLHKRDGQVDVLRDRLARASADMVAAQEARNDLARRLEDSLARNRLLEASLAEKEGERDALRQQERGTALELAAARATGAALEDELARANRRLDTGAAELDRIRRDWMAGQSEIGELRRELKLSRRAAAGFKSESDQLSRQLDSTVAKLRDVEAKARATVENLRLSTAEAGDLRARGAARDTEFSRLLAEHDALLATLAEERATAQAKAAALTKAEEKARDLHTQIAGLESQRHGLEGALVRKQASAEVVASALSATRMELAAQALRIDRLSALLEDREAVLRQLERFCDAAARGDATLAPAAALFGQVARRALRSLRFFLRRGPVRWALRERDTRLLRNSGYFQPSYYVERYPDVLDFGSPLEHFLEYGAAEGRRPNRLFDPTFYCQANPDVAAAGVNPLVHYLRHGEAEGRSPMAGFDARAALTNGQVAVINGETAFAACLRQLPDPAAEINLARPAPRAERGRALGPGSPAVPGGEIALRAEAPDGVVAEAAARFDEAFYLQWCPEAKAYPGGAFQHYVRHYLSGARPVIDADAALEMVRDINELLPVVDTAPRVSVIVPVYGQLAYTLGCLRSLAALQDGIAMEIIVIDDCSPDLSPQMLPHLTGIRYLRNPDNLGFLRSCNRAAAKARGEFVVFLNNDTRVLPGWLVSLVRTFRDYPQAGLVGSKLIYADGRLQEAGGNIWADGSGRNFGRLQSPDLPAFNYVRDVDYCSGASIMLPTRLWQQLGGFDELFAPAYYEDTDLAFRVRRAGYRTLYQPFSRIVHFEGITSGTDLSTGVKRHQAINQPKFVARWKREIARHGMPSDQRGPYCDRRAKRRALFIDACTPTPDQDSGSNDTFYFMKIFRELGFHVSFIPATNLAHWGRYTEDLQHLGVECLYRPYLKSIESYLQEMGPTFDLVMLYRVPVAAGLIDQVRAYAPQAKVVFDTVDLHHLREEREAQLKHSASGLAKAAATKVAEVATMTKADATIVLSEIEVGIVSKIAPMAKTYCIPIVREIPGRLAEVDGRRDIVFIGGFQHVPNVDAVRFFVSDVWPLVERSLPDARLIIVGSNVTPEIDALASPTVEVRGFVEDLTTIFTSCKITVAPLRYGAGIKGKIVTSLSYGVPCVATSIAAEGMGLHDGKDVLIADDPNEMAEKIVRVYRDPTVWQSLSDAGIAFTDQRFSVDSVQGLLGRMLMELGFDIVGTRELR